MKREEVTAQMNSVRRFVGKLTKIQYASGQPCAQLVFETPQGPYLSLSRDIHLLQGLTVGKTYRVEGPKREVGGRSYWHEPVITPVRHWQVRQRTWVTGLAVVIGLGVVTGVLLYDQRQVHFATAESVSNHAADKPVNSGATTLDTAQVAAPAASPADTATAAGNKRSPSSLPIPAGTTTAQPVTPPSTPSDPDTTTPPIAPPAATPAIPAPAPAPTSPPADPSPPANPTPPTDPTLPANPPVDPTPPPTQP